MDRFCNSAPTKNTLLSTYKGAFFELSVPLARNVKYASQVKRTSCVKCAVGMIFGTLNFTAPKEQLHYAARHNFTAAYRNFTFYVQGYALICLRKCGIIIARADEIKSSAPKITSVETKKSDYGFITLIKRNISSGPSSGSRFSSSNISCSG